MRNTATLNRNVTCKKKHYLWKSKLLTFINSKHTCSFAIKYHSMINEEHYRKMVLIPEKNAKSTNVKRFISKDNSNQDTANVANLRKT